MGYIIGDNQFTHDSRGVRGTRLDFISGNIDTWAAELEIEASFLAWAHAASAAFDAALIHQTGFQGAKDMAFQESQEADDALYVRYIELRGLVRSLNVDDKLTLKEYGVTGKLPKARLDKYYKAQELIKKNGEQIAAGDPNALPAGMVASLAALADDMETVYKETGTASRIAKESTKTFKSLYDADTIKLRVLYNWCIAYWGKYSHNLIVLGFVEAKHRHGGQPGAPKNLAYDSIASVFSWDDLESETSYQCAMKNANQKAAEWDEIYDGTATSFKWQSVVGSWKVKVRARNKHGFGKWGDEIEVEVG